MNNTGVFVGSERERERACSPMHGHVFWQEDLEGEWD